jgi:hypothetical protein
MQTNFLWLKLRADYLRLEQSWRSLLLDRCQRSLQNLRLADIEIGAPLEMKQVPGVSRCAEKTTRADEFEAAAHFLVALLDLPRADGTGCPGGGKNPAGI